MKIPLFGQYLEKAVLTHLERMEKELLSVQTDKDVEPIHEARVSSRRLRNGFCIFKKYFPDKKKKRWASIIKKNMTVLGEARDIDMQMAFLSNIKTKIEKSGHSGVLKELIARLKGKRAAKQPEILNAVKALLRSGVIEDMAQATSSAAASNMLSNKEVRKLCEKKIQKRMRRFYKMGKYVYMPSDVTGLHRLRIAAKKLRYTLESFSDFFGKEMILASVEVKKVQDILGDVHDLDVWIEAFPGVMHEFKLDKDKRRSFGETVYFGKLFREMRNEYYHEFVRVWEKMLESKFKDKLETILKDGARWKK